MYKQIWSLFRRPNKKRPKSCNMYYFDVEKFYMSHQIWVHINKYNLGTDLLVNLEWPCQEEYESFALSTHSLRITFYVLERGVCTSRATGRQFGKFGESKSEEHVSVVLTAPRRLHLASGTERMLMASDCLIVWIWVTIWDEICEATAVVTLNGTVSYIVTSGRKRWQGNLLWTW